MSGETKRRRGPRPVSTYRGAGRNAVLRGEQPREPWGPKHYFRGHRNAVRSPPLNLGKLFSRFF